MTKVMTTRHKRKERTQSANKDKDRKRGAPNNFSVDRAVFRVSDDEVSPPMHPILACGEPSAKRQKSLGSLLPVPVLRQGRSDRRNLYQSQDGLAPSPSTKRCCKQDLKRCLKVGEILEVTRVEQHYLDAFNQGEKIRGRFTGNDIFDLTQNIPYRSLSKWVKKRLVDVGALGHKSNISGWDFVAVERDGRKQSLRMLVENVVSDSGSHGEGGSQSASPSSSAEAMQRFFGIDAGNADGRGAKTSIAERMQQLLRPPELSPVALTSSTASSPESVDDEDAPAKFLRTKCAALREELTQARAYVAHIETQLATREQELEQCFEKTRLSEVSSNDETGYQLRSR